MQTTAGCPWLELHRLVEAYSRTMGVPFTEVFEELEARYGFARAGQQAPALATLQAAATDLQERRSDALTRRRAWIDARRRAKARRRSGAPGQIEAPAQALLDAEARSRTYAATIPRVGYWGWARRRKAEGA